MDPKAFDHLDPKLKETYARVMGTPTPANDTPVQPTTTDAAPTIDPNQPPLGSSPFPQTPTQNEGPNPGTGPTITTMPNDTSSTLSSPGDTTSSIDQSQSTSPANSSFFSNPSPSTTEPPQTDTDGLSQPVEPPAEPALVTPYTPDDLGANQSSPLIETTTSQPFPSPSSVNQAAPHEASSLLRVLYIVGAVIFFIIYTIFWIKVFGLPLPFFS